MRKDVSWRTFALDANRSETGGSGAESDCLLRIIEKRHRADQGQIFRSATDFSNHDPILGGVADRAGNFPTSNLGFMN